MTADALSPSVASSASSARPDPFPAIVLFDVDGVLRDVSGSYRRAIQATVRHYSGWTPDPSTIDALKGEGLWNNDWEASLELLRRHRQAAAPPDRAEVEPAAAAAHDRLDPLPPREELPELEKPQELPELEELATVFGGFYFGGDPWGPPARWRGFIRDEQPLVEPAFFEALTAAGLAWGFVSGAEGPSARFLLEERLGLVAPPLVAMEDAPQKPDPTGLLALAERLAAGRNRSLGREGPPVVYVGDTVADIETVVRARRQRPDQRFLALAVAPPHLHGPERTEQRRVYEDRLRAAGADHLLRHTAQLGQAPGDLLSSLLGRAGDHPA
jgi:HAD superfamily phosphatase